MALNKYIYKFECFGNELSLPIGGKFTDPTDGDIVKVKRFSKSKHMWHLVIKVNNAPEIVLEYGYRTSSGILRTGFQRWEVLEWQNWAKTPAPRVMKLDETDLPTPPIK